MSKSALNGDTVWNYEYDLLNRLVKVAKNNEDVASYVYDESGLRLKKQGTDTAIYYVFDTGGNVLYEQENREYLEYIYVLGKHFARVDGNLDNLGDRTKYFYHTDHLGSTVAVTDETGQTVWSSEYTPFGGKHSVTGELGKATKFTGKDLDEDIGLYYFNARWYDQEVGRFISEDSINDPNSPNVYVYGANNPLKYIDPTGHWNDTPEWPNLLPSWEFNYKYSSTSTEWQKFLLSYTSMNETFFNFYLKGLGINYTFNQNNLSTYKFLNTDGQTAVNRPFGFSLTDAQRMSFYNSTIENTKAFLGNNPGLSLEQVKSIFDAALISADNLFLWGAGKNEFRFEGRGSNYEGIYNAQSVIMNQGMIMGTFTRASTLPDPEYIGGTIREGIYDYVVGLHPMGDTKKLPSIPVADATWETYANRQYKAVNLFYNGSRALPTEYPNLQHLVVGGNSHAGFTAANGLSPRTGAQGCPTLYWPDYYYYISLFNTGESGKFIIIR